MIDVVIPTYNNNDSLKKVLAGFSKQTFKDFKIHVVNDGGEDNVMDVIQDFDLDIHHYYLSPPSTEFRAASARNQGIFECKNERIICFDSDMIPSFDVVEKHFSYGKDEKIVVGLRKRIFPHGIVEDDRIRKGGQRSIDFLSMKQEGKKIHHLCHSCNISYPTHAAHAIGGFWEKMVGWGREDAEFAMRLCRYGCTTFLDDSIIGYHIEHDPVERDLSFVEDLYQKSMKMNGYLRSDFD